MKKIIFIVAIIILLLIGGTAWFVLKYRQSGSAEQQSIVVPEPTKPQEPIIDEFANDKDRDGVLDDEEQKLGLSNKEFDTDKDGLSDYSEINKWKTDPAKKDTDGDGFGDGIEVIKGYNPLGAGKLK